MKNVFNNHDNLKSIYTNNKKSLPRPGPVPIIFQLLNSSPHVTFTVTVKITIVVIFPLTVPEPDPGLVSVFVSVPVTVLVSILPGHLTVL